MRYLRRTLAGSFFITLAGLSACADQQPVVPEGLSVQAAKPDGTGKPVKVDETDPSSGEQTERLFVRILGSGFDDGSVATWLKDGDPTGVQTHSTDYVSDGELLADIEIDEEARLGLWDVEVMTIRGKKGIGIESFEVKEKTPPGQVEFDAYVPIDLGTLGKRKGSSVASSVSDELPGGSLFVIGTSQADANSFEVPVSWEVRVTASDTIVIGPTALPLPSPEFYLGRAGGLALDGSFFTGWAAYDDGMTLYRAVRWSYAGGVTDPVTFEPFPHPDDPGAFFSSAGRGTNVHGDVVGNSSSNHPVTWDVDGDGEIDFKAARLATFWDGVSGIPMALLSPLGGRSIAYGINRERYMVGEGKEPAYFNPGGELETHAILWFPDGTPCDLGETGVRSEAYKITDVSVDGTVFIAGYSDSRGSVWEVMPVETDHTCEVVQQWMMDVESVVGGIRAVDGGWYTTGRGQIIMPGQDHPFVWRVDLLGSVITPLGEVGRPYKGNNDGTIAGFVPVKDLDHAVLWLPRNP